MEHLPPITTPFGPLRAPTGCTITHLRPRRAPLTTVERLSETCPPAGLRRDLIQPANDRFEREWEPLPWHDDDEGLTDILDRDRRGIDALVYVLGAFVTLIGVLAWGLLP